VPTAEQTEVVCIPNPSPAGAVMISAQQQRMLFNTIWGDFVQVLKTQKIQNPSE
jgi:hypothetical protein